MHMFRIASPKLRVLRNADQQLSIKCITVVAPFLESWSTLLHNGNKKKIIYHKIKYNYCH